MKKVYQSPVFIGEAYSFNSSIATCNAKPSEIKEPLTIDTKTKVCQQCNGDKYTSDSLAYKYAQEHGDTTPEEVTIFNDGEQSGCQFDWDGKVVKQTGLGFTQTFFGNSGTDKKHAPAVGSYNFFS